ncbi:MAG: type II toxin-antitoxin system PemK/MazF family toxin [Cyanobacteria bacterium P01_E01_bin.43]
MVVAQGDIYWLDLGAPIGSAPGYQHPHVILQNNDFNRSNIRTAVVCALTSNLKRAKAPGNVLLQLGEANLPKQSVVNISQIFTVDRSQLGAKLVRFLLNECGKFWMGFTYCWSLATITIREINCDRLGTHIKDQQRCQPFKAGKQTRLSNWVRMSY